MTEKLKGKEVYQTYFITSEGEATLHQCKECSRSVRQNIGKGYASLVSHVTTTHKENCAQKAGAKKLPAMKALFTYVSFENLPRDRDDSTSGV